MDIMKMKNIIPITEARKTFFDLCDKSQKPGNHFIITVKGKPSMVLMSAKDFERLKKKIGLKKKQS